MYQNIYYQRNTNTVHLFDDRKGYMRFPYDKYCYIKSPSGDKVALDGTKVKKIHKWGQEEEQSGHLYESDINPETRILIDQYCDSDDVSENHNVLFIDIEVDTTKNFPDINEANNTITAISVYLQTLKQYHVLLLDTENKMKYDNNDSDCEINTFSDEESMLEYFMGLYSDYGTTIITGWNIDYFDIPYLYNRITKVLGKNTSSMLSPIGIVEKNKRTGIYTLAGVSCLDYLALYKKFSINEEPSYTLDAISNKELGKGKIKYEGTLDTLYKTDIKKFVEYNLNDVTLVLELDNKLKFIELTKSICHKGHVPYNCIFTSSRYLEGAILTYMKTLGIVSTNCPVKEVIEIDLSDEEDDESKEGGFEGAYVKPPLPGRYEWLTCLDATSLYPTTIMTLNISPETLIGKVQDWDTVNMLAKSKGKYQDLDTLIFEYKSGKTVKYTKDELKEFLEKNKYSLAGNGSVYNTTNKGLIPSILEKWFDERLKYKAAMKKFAASGATESEEYYDRLQYVTKILLNSMYGVLGLSSFRFFDLWNAEAVTITGQDALRFADKIANKYLVDTFNASNIDRVIYEDTDSCYILLNEFIKKDGTEVEQVKRISGEIANAINSKLPSFVKAHLFSDYNKLVFKEESAIKSGFWLAKKRYAYSKVWDLESDKPSDKVIIKGLDVVRSNFPILFRNFMKEILSDILNFEDKQVIDSKIVDLQTKIHTFELLEVAKPTSAKNLDKFKCEGTKFKKGTPAHIKAALAYNFLLKYHKLHLRLQPILSGSKVKWVYLRDNVFGLDAIAFKGFDDPIEIMRFIEDHIDHNKNFESNLSNKLQDFYNALNWGNLPTITSEKLTNYFDFY